MKTTRRMSRALLGALIAVSVVIAVQPAWAQVTYSDSTFNNADWELITVWVIGGSSSAAQVTAGGNPGLFREIRNNSRRGDGEIWAFHRKIGATYDPRVEGEISSIDYSEDAILISGFGQGQATGPVLRQDGKVYVGALTTLLLTPDFSWVTKVLNGLGQDNFFLLTSSGFVLSGHPDFSANGSPIEFGFLRANSRSGTIVGGIDNWSMTITSLPSPPPLPPQRCVLPPSGLVSWWPGDGNFTDIQDGNNGTSSGGVTFVTGKVGQAFDFNSTNFIRIANSSNLQPGQITLDAWIKPVFAGRPFQSADADIILEKLDSSLNGYALAIAMHPTFPFLQAPAGGVPLGTPVFLLNVTGGANQIFGSSPLPNDGLFHHVAGTYDGATMRLFLDGVEVASRSVIGSIVHAAAADAFIGGESAFPRNSKAAIDEVEIFNRALDASEIQGIFNAGSAGKCKPGACIPPPTGLVSWWDADAVFGTTAEDIQDGNHGILTNGATTAPGQVGQAFSFDGVNDFVEVPNVTNLNPSLITVDAWINPSSATNVNAPPIVTKFSSPSSGVFKGYAFHIAGSGGVSLGAASVQNLYFAVGTDTGLREEVTSFATVPLNTFTHVAATYDGIDIRIYMDGVEVATKVPRGFDATGGAISPSATILGIGAQPDFNRHFEGLIDEVEIFDRALTASEIQAIFNAGSAGKCKTGACLAPPTGLVSWWDGDAVSGTTATDIQDGNLGTLFNGATTAPGRVGLAFSFDGVDDFVEVADNPNLRPQQLTVDAWVFPRSFDGDFDIFVARDSGIVGSKSRSWNFQANHPLAGSCFNKPAFSMFFDGGQNPFVCGTKQLPLGQWSHMAVTYDGNRIRLYINGAREGGASQQPLAASSLNAEATSLTIGSLDGSLFFFNGLVDEVEVFDRALDAAEIQGIFNAGSAGKCKTPQPPGDTTPPETNIASAIDGDGGPVAPGGSTPSTSITFTFTGTDDVGVVGFECRLDGAAFTACTSPQAFTGLALGSHTFQVRSRDTAGNADTTPASQSWTILAPDTTPPVVIVPADFTVEATSAAGTVVSFSGSATDDVDGSLPVTCTPASGSTFALGATPVNCSATDAAGNTGSAAFSVTVVETTPPSITAPADVTVEATGTLTAVSLGSPTVSDLVDPSPTVSNDAPAAGFPFGTSVVTWTALDSSGNSATATQTVTVVDTTPPAVAVPADITEEATSVAGATVSHPAATATDILDGILIPTCSPTSGSTFAIATTTVTCTATDAAGNSGVAMFNVAIVDTTPPVVTITSAVDGDAALVANGDSTVSRSMTLTFTAVDNVAVAGIQCSLDGAAFAACTSPQGFTGLGAGGHIFQVRATDSAGNTNLTPAGFAWTVLTPPEALQPIIDKIDGLLGDPSTPQKARKELEDAREKLVEALELLDKGKIKQAFKEIEKGLKELLKAADAGVDVSECNLALVNIGRRMAQDALTEALQLPGDAKEIEKALEEMAKAQAELDKGKPDKAIKHFRKAWDHAQKALKKTATGKAITPIIDQIDDLLGDPGTPNDARKPLEEAREELEEALEELQEGETKEAFEGIEKAVKELLKAADKGADVSELIVGLIDIARQMAQDALTEALQFAGGAQADKEIEKAMKEMAKAQAELDKGKPDKAIKHFSKAWEHAQEAHG